MWCPRCHTEVAAEIAQNGQSLNCTACGTEIQRVHIPTLHPDTRSARELLDRWSKSDLLDGMSGSEARLQEPSPLSTMTPEAIPASHLPKDAAPPPVRQFEAASPAPIATAEPLVPPIVKNMQPEQADSSEGEAASQDLSSSRRERPERTRPDRSAPKPRTSWRIDAAHNVTQPTTPPPPVPPRRPYFSTSAVNDDVVSASPPTAPTEQPRQESIPIAETPVETTNVQRKPADADRLSRRDRTEITVTAQTEDAEEFDRAAAEKSRQRDITTEKLEAPASIHRRLDTPHELPGAPHFDLQSFLSQDTRKPGRSESIWGQVLAYFGVGLITVGTTLVLWAWFKQTPQYAPTGWLICTVGQMLLFLGVITLVSGGMQQASHEVTRRVEYLGSRILRFEQSAEQAMRAPHFDELQNRNRTRAKSSQTQNNDKALDR